jgi:hypothetical protein
MTATCRKKKPDAITATVSDALGPSGRQPPHQTDRTRTMKRTLLDTAWAFAFLATTATGVAAADAPTTTTPPHQQQEAPDTSLSPEDVPGHGRGRIENDAVQQVDKPESPTDFAPPLPDAPQQVDQPESPTDFAPPLPDASPKEPE